MKVPRGRRRGGGRKIALPSSSLRVLLYLPLTDGKVQTSQTDGQAGGQRTVRQVDGGRLQTTWAESFLPVRCQAVWEYAENMNLLRFPLSSIHQNPRIRRGIATCGIVCDLSVSVSPHAFLCRRQTETFSLSDRTPT